jgi:hypothetical protein
VQLDVGQYDQAAFDQIIFLSQSVDSGCANQCLKQGDDQPALDKVVNR